MWKSILRGLKAAFGWAKNNPDVIIEAAARLKKKQAETGENQ
jgi:hypothetical protein